MKTLKTFLVLLAKETAIVMSVTTATELATKAIKKIRKEV